MTFESIQLLLFLMCTITIQAVGQSKAEKTSSHLVKKTKDFKLTGDGSADIWQKTEWLNLDQRNNYDREEGKKTRAKLLYSDTGLYVLFESEDHFLTTPFEQDFEELWHGDVVEIFLMPDSSRPHYFEYELSPLNYELPLIVSNVDGELLHWLPFENSYHQKSGRKTRHKTTVKNGEKKNGAAIEGWTAEIFIPFKLLHPLENIYPISGTTWRANLYRIDHDEGETLWSWSPINKHFHEIENFGTFRFE